MCSEETLKRLLESDPNDPLVASSLRAFKSNLAMMLRDVPPGTTADLEAACAAWWDGQQIVFALLRYEDRSRIDEEFDLDNQVWSAWRPELEEWMRNQRYSMRTEVLEKLTERGRVTPSGGWQRCLASSAPAAVSPYGPQLSPAHQTSTTREGCEENSLLPSGDAIRQLERKGTDPVCDRSECSPETVLLTEVCSLRFS